MPESSTLLASRSLFSALLTYRLGRRGPHTDHRYVGVPRRGDPRARQPATVPPPGDWHARRQRRRRAPGCTSAGAHAPVGVLAGLSGGDEAPIAHRFPGDHDFGMEGILAGGRADDAEEAAR